MDNYAARLARGRVKWGDKFTESGLTPKFRDAFNKGQSYRVKVRSPGGHERWGYVSTTTGWQPAFLLMMRRGQHGSSDVLGSEDVIIEGHYIKA